MSKLWASYYLIALSLALRAIAYDWTPCSLGAWIRHLQACSQPCYGEAFYDTFFNSTACGNYTTTLNSTEKSDVKCLCTNVLASISDGKNVTHCDNVQCGPGVYNVTYYDLNQDAYLRMCEWALGMSKTGKFSVQDSTNSVVMTGEGTCNGTTTSIAVSVAPQALQFLTGLSLVISILM